MYDRYGITKLSGQVQIMHGDQDGLALCLQLAQHLKNGQRMLDIKLGSRLIEQEKAASVANARAMMESWPSPPDNSLMLRSFNA